MRRAALLFDLDGTLIDSAADLAAAVNHARETLGFPAVPEAKVRGWIGDGVNVLLTRAIPDQSLVPRALEIFRAYYGEHLLDRTVPYPGMVAALESLSARGARMAVVTNKVEAASRRIVEALGLGPFFGARIIGSDSGHGRKPEPGPVRAALAAIGASASEAIMVGDGRNDILVARAAGVASCGVGWGIGAVEELHGLGPDIFIDRVDDMVAALGD